jgi:hypothetical protein
MGFVWALHSPRELRAQTAEEAGSNSAASKASESAEDADAATLLARAEEAMTDVDYPRSRALAERALGRGGLHLDESIRAYRVLALSSAQLEDTEGAERAFIKLLALEPDSKLLSRLSPTRRSAVLSAQGFWSVHKEAFGLDVSYARADRQLVVHVKDPLAWAKTVQVWWRFAGHGYQKIRRSATRELVLDIDGIGPTDPLDVYVFVVDDHGNVLMQRGRERDPELFGLSEQELAALLQRDIRGGQTGSYARRLEELGVQVGVHGYASLELKPVGGVTSFDLHHATVMVRANLQRAVSVEIALEWEHLGPEQGEFYIPHAFLDVKLHDLFVLRGGFFEAPVGAFNEYLYPDFLRITGLQPLFSENVVPALWSEVGLQARGRLALGGGPHATYAAFVSNGLEQHDDAPHDGLTQEGGDLEAMRFNERDKFSFDKALGGRLGLEIGDFDVGASGYTGRYTVERARRLQILDSDFSFRGRKLTVRTEGAIALQEVTRGLLKKYGAYALVAARPIPYLEPYVEYDYANLGGWVQRGIVGVAAYPFPNERPTRSLRLKSEAGYAFPQVGQRAFVWLFQLTTGF